VSADLLSVAVRLLGWVSLFQAAGAAFFLALFGEWAPNSSTAIRRLGRWAALAGVLFLLSHQALEAARMSDALSGTLDAHMESLAWRGTGGIAVVIAVTGLVVIVIGMSLKGRPGSSAASIGGCIATCSAVLTGHTSVHTERALLGGLLAVHLLIAAFWFGALVPLILCSRREPNRAAIAVLNGFSRSAGLLVPCIAIAGLSMALILMPHRAAWSTTYGYLIVAKIAGFVVLMGLAAWNRWRAVPAMAGGSMTASAALRRVIVAEWVVIVAVLTTTSVLTTFFSPQ
jgi:putative copper export protein